MEALLAWLLFLLMPAALAYGIWVWTWQARLLKHLKQQRCQLCKADWSESIVHVHGRWRSLPEVQLDRFQQRFAYAWVLCCDCEGYNLVTRDGRPFRGYYRTSKT